MAPLPENNTSRFILKYTSSLVPHTMTIRFPEGVTSTEAIAIVTAFCNSLKSFMNANDSFYGADWSDAGTNFSLPLAWTTIDGTSVGAGFAEDPESAFVSVCGRSSGGRRISIKWFTQQKVSNDYPPNNRYQPGVSTNADDIIAAFQGLYSTVGEDACAIDGLPVQIYDYLNIAKNSYWQRKQRVAVA